MGKQRGAAVTFMVLSGALRDAHGLPRQRVVSNLTYLTSEGYVDVIEVSKSFTTRHGTVIPSVTRYYCISAAGINKVGGTTQFKRETVPPVRVEAIGQNIITVGDGNQVSATFDQNLAGLSVLRDAVKAAPQMSVVDKMDLLTDINLMKSQFATPNPDRAVLHMLWRRIENTAVVAGLGDVVAKLGPWIMENLP
jgi:hypothetical protein